MAVPSRVLSSSPLPFPTASHLGVLLQSASGCLSCPSKNLNDLLEFHEQPLVPGPCGRRWALPAPAFLRRKGNPAMARRARGRLWSDLDLCGLVRGVFSMRSMRSSLEVRHRTCGFGLFSLVFTTLYSPKWDWVSSRSKAQTRAVGFGLQRHVCVCMYICTYVYIYTTGVHPVLAAAFSLVVKT